MKNIETGEIDYDELRELALKHQPKIILAGFSAYPRQLDYAKFVQIGNEVGALLMADMSHIAGLIAADVLPNPLDFGFHVMTTTTHKTLRGPRGGLILSMGKIDSPLKATDKTIENIPTLIDRAVFPGTQGGPHMNNIAAKAVAMYEASQPEFKAYAQKVLDNAKVLSEELKRLGFCLITGGTDNHLIVIDMIKSFGVGGKETEKALASVGIIVNANVVPDDALPPFSPSGIRLGTPAVTTRGLGSEQMILLANWIKAVIDNMGDELALSQIHSKVKAVANIFQ